MLVSFDSMLLVLTLVYLFNGFQTHAAPLANLLAEEEDSPRRFIGARNIGMDGNP